jgi:hypothetical protein
MASPRPTPFALVFGDTATQAFPEIQAALARSHTDPRDRDGFLMLREAILLLRELRPEEGLGEGIDQLAALLHHSYLFWAAGSQTVELPAEHLADFLGNQPFESTENHEPPPYYVQVPERRVWAESVAGHPPEPLDGCFVYRSRNAASLRVLGVFGLHRERAGFTVVEVGGPRATSLVRPDGTPLFSPLLSGGTAAGLYSLAGGEELLELGWRTRSLLVPSPVEESEWRA